MHGWEVSLIRPHARLGSWLSAAAAACLLLLFAAGAARAEFTVCNQTLDVVNLAVGQRIEETPADAYVQTEGWWTVGANQCVNVIRDELVNRFIYIYAIDVFGQPLLNGVEPLCVGPRRFVIRERKDCWVQGYKSVPFYEVDTLEQERWTLFLSIGSAQ